MTILAIAQACSTRLMLPVPTSFIGSTSNNMILLKAMIDQTLAEIADDFPWPELQKEYTFTLSEGVANYDLPPDYDRRQNITLWNRSQSWPLIGPIDAVMWQQIKSGLITSLPRQRFRVKGWQDAQFYIDPTPGTDEASQTIVYEYISNITKRPKTWVTATAYLSGVYTSYNGNIYKATSNGTSGATAPTWTTGSGSDGGVTWAYQSTYENFIADTDEVILDNQTIIDGAVWRFKAARGLDYEELKQRAEEQIQITQSKLLGADVLSVNGANNDGYPHLISIFNYPDGGWGGLPS